jgi:hypothetical protein
MVETAQVTLECPQCEVNDYGGFVLECSSCGQVFQYRLGQDIQMSRVHSGAKVLARYDEGIDGDKERTLATFGLKDA